ncbi:MAG TPA: hypothetical protein P5274_02775 [Candidatus Paceibacterota bacterium]|nr:hypothetical protein [Candidatus Paceibacterota bacterium]
MSKLKLLAFSFALTPVLALAQASTFDNTGYFESVAQTIFDVINLLIPAAMGLVFLVFFWYLYKYIMGNVEDKEKSKSGLLWSVIAIVIMLSIYGIANWAQGITGVGVGSNTITPPNIMTN